MKLTEETLSTIIMTSVRVALGFCLIISAFLMPTALANGFAECVGTDCVTPYVWSKTTVNCTEELKSPSRDCRWAAGAGTRMDEIIYGGRIAAYKLQWFGGSWSGWFVPGMNDRDPKFNVNLLTCSVPYYAKSLRLAWAYFYDHTHTIIICR
jgi:hypothetical protein